MHWCHCFDKKVTLMFYKTIRVKFIVYLLQLYVFIFPNLLPTQLKRIIQQLQEGVWVWEEFYSCLTDFLVMIPSEGNRILISLYSVDFVQFLQATLLHWIQVLFVCFSVFGLRRVWCTKLQFLGLNLSFNFS